MARRDSLKPTTTKPRTHSLTPARKTALAEYRKARARIQQTVHRAEKRGYRFEQGTVPQTASQLSNLSTQKIKSLTRSIKRTTAADLYKQATALSSETGKPITGTQRVAEERSERSKKSAATKRSKREQLKEATKQREYWEREEQRLRDELSEAEEPSEETIPEYLQPQNDVDFEEEQKRKDAVNRARMSHEQEFRNQFTTGETTYRSIIDMINDVLATNTYKYAAWDLMSDLNEQIATYGKDAVMVSIGNAPSDMIEDVQIALRYNPGDSRHDRAVLALRELITGEIPSAAEVARFQDRMDADAYTDDYE